MFEAGLSPSLCQQLQARVKQLELQRDDLSRDLSSIYSQIIELKNHEAPISRLPPEVLNAVFHAGRIMNDDAKVPFQVLVSRVIRSWRETSLRDPSLWDTIVVLPGHNPSTIRSFLRRSRDRHLIIRLAYSSDEWPRYFTRNLEELAMHSYRWRELHIEVSDQHLMHRIIRSLGPLEVHRLEKANIQLRDCGFDNLSNFEMVVFRGGAPRLSHISLTGINPFSFLTVDTKITMFRLSSTKYEPVFRNVGEFTLFLLSLSFITCLVLEGCIVVGQAQLRVPLPYLQHLVLDGSSSNSYPNSLLAIIRSMKLPNLESLVIVGGSTEVLREIPYPLASLKRLELWDTSSTSLTPDVMQLIPSITHLSLIRSNAPIILRRLRDAVSSIPWPNLHTLTIEIEAVDDNAMSEDGDFTPVRTDVDNGFTELISGVVIARELARAPIARLNLDSDLLCGISDFRKAWLRGEGTELVDNGFSTFKFNLEAMMNH